MLLFSFIATIYHFHTYAALLLTHRPLDGAFMHTNANTFFITSTVLGILSAFLSANQLAPYFSQDIFMPQI